MNCPKCGLINTGNMAVGLAMPQCMCHWQSPTPPRQPEQPKVRTGNCLRVGVCASEGHKIQPPRQPLTDEEIAHATAPVFMGGNPSLTGIARAIESAHGIKEKNT